ncbi:hypothetical protein C8R44DRAFT_866782 [Mycena epipterygia]|nr:hypothetical protein C8R44DRAFT_866782 [Mycena epipterygia]
MRLPSTEEPSAIVIAEPIIARIIRAQPNFPLPLKQNEEPTYEIRSADNMGLGMFALRDLKAGDLLLSERPALVYPNGFRASAVASESSELEDAQQLEAVFEVALEHMPVNVRVMYRKLANAKAPGSAGGDLVGIASTNSFKLGLHSPGGLNVRWSVGDYRAVYLDVSRINHSCSPNAVADFDFPSFSIIVRIARDIKKGDQIFTTYIDLNGTKAERGRLLSQYTDSCGCPVCSNPPAGSDDRRRALASYTPGSFTVFLAKYIDNPRHLLTHTIRCIQDFEDEAMQSHPVYPMVLDIAGRLWGMVGNAQLADSQRRKAGMFYDMRASESSRKMVEYLFEPEEGMADRLHSAVSDPTRYVMKFVPEFFPE